MRRLYITRPKRFVGTLIPYSVFLSYPGKHPDEPESQWAPGHVLGIPIANGETKSIPLRCERCAVVVNAMTSTGAAGGPAYYIEAGDEDVRLEIVTKYSFWGGSRYELHPIK